MTTIKWIWWLGGPLFGSICIGYAIAYAGWGLSAWGKPEPDAFISTIAFLSAGIWTIRDAIEDTPT